MKNLTLSMILFCLATLTFKNNSVRAETSAVNGDERMEEFVLIGKMKARTDCEKKLEDALKRLSLGTHTEPGCLFYALHRDTSDSSIFVLVEGWASKQALTDHFNSPHFAQEFPLISSLIIGEPELTYLTSLCSGEKGTLFN